MNYGFLSQLSIEELTQQSTSSLPSIVISSQTFKSYVQTLLNFLLEQQLRTKIWLKLPQTKNWLNIIEKYQQESQNTEIFFCSQSKTNLTNSDGSQPILPRPVIPFKLANSKLFKRESFLIFSSPEFSGLILAQWQRGKIQGETRGRRLQQPHLTLVTSFTPKVISQVLLKIKQAISIPNPEKIITEKELNLLRQKGDSSELVNHLFLKQIESNELLSKPNNSSFSNVITLSQSLQLNGEFLHNLIRELRSPITHMKTALSLLESKQIKGEQRQRYLQMLNHECERQNSLISGLLELLQLENYPPIESSFYVHLEQLVPGIVSTYQPLAKEKEIQLGYTIPNQLPPVSCPIPWLRQIIINLLNNSLQFTPPQGRVFVQASLKDENIELTISDTGIGIEMKELGKIFDSFYRGKTAVNEQITGAGLGLTIVRQLVERCGGSISVSSKVDKGSIFKVLLPTIVPELIEE
jgi:signal transduction histidine kinase